MTIFNDAAQLKAWREQPVGTSFEIPLAYNPSMPFLHADNTLIITPPANSAEASVGKGSGFVEIALLRTSFRPVSQDAVMGDFEDGLQRVSTGGFNMAPFHEEIGRVRLDTDSAVNMATALLKQVVDQNGVDPDWVIGRLVDRGVIHDHVSGND